MATFYIRPKSQDRYGARDGTTYLTAWNGVEEVDWRALCAGNPATLWICRDKVSPTAGVLTVCIEWEYSPQRRKNKFASAALAELAAEPVQS